MPQYHNSSPLQLRVNTVPLHGFKIKQIEVKGRLPDNTLHKDVEFVVSVFDCEGGGIHPIMTTERRFRESFSPAFQSRKSLRDIIHESQKIDFWLPISLLPPPVFVRGPYPGKRKLLAVVRLIDESSYLDVVAGELIDPDGYGLLWTGEIRFFFSMTGDGYVKLAKQHRRLESIALRLGMAVAHADGEIDDREIDVFRNTVDWWKGASEMNFDGLSEKQRSSSYMGMMVRAIEKAMKNEIDTTRLLKSLRKNASREFWRETLSLCYTVMSANGIAHTNQLRLLRKIADSSDLDTKEIMQLRDQNIVNFEITTKIESPTEELLGIDADWNIVEIKRHLRAEYRKWNGRLNTLPEGKARENAQSILNMIGEAYKEYTLPKVAPETTPATSKTPQPPEADQTSKIAPDTDQTPKENPYGLQLNLFGGPQ